MRIRFVLFALMLASSAFAQISDNSLPPSLMSDFSALLGEKKVVVHTLDAPNVQKWKTEDSEQAEQGRFAAPISTDISPQNAGNWTILPDSSSVWRCAVTAPGAMALILLFDQFKLPAGTRFYAYDAQHKRVLGAYTDQSCIPSGYFTIGTLPGATAILELVVPAHTPQTAQIHLNRVDYAYHLGALSEGDPMAAFDFSQSLQCNVNINCSQAADWQTEKKGVARILMVFTTGSAWCTGSLIANAAGTGTPYFLTANHCQILIQNGSPLFEQWAFHFDYEAPTCNNPATEPAYKSILGCQRLAFRAETDMMLLQLNPIPNNYGVYFNGWNRSATPPTSSAFIHHPLGDIKKFSRDDQAATSFASAINWGAGFGSTQPNTHWKVVPDVGIYEPGSSGCPIFDSNKRIMGQLHGGNANNCTVLAAYFGMFHLSWDQGGTPGTQLKNWLDPNNTGNMTQNGYPQPLSPISISGNLKLWSGEVLPNTRVALGGSKIDTVTTDSNGDFTFINAPAGGNFTIKPFRTTNNDNGVTTYDLVLISKHILNVDPLGSPWKMIAADINESNTITNFDIVEIRKLILGLYLNFPATTSWRFFPASTTFANPINPFETALPAGTLNLNGALLNTTGVNFFGVKMGDVNASVDPGL